MEPFNTTVSCHMVSAFQVIVTVVFEKDPSQTGWWSSVLSDTKPKLEAGTTTASSAAVLVFAVFLFLFLFYSGVTRFGVFQCCRLSVPAAAVHPV